MNVHLWLHFVVSHIFLFFHIKSVNVFKNSVLKIRGLVFISNSLSFSFSFYLSIYLFFLPSSQVEKALPKLQNHAGCSLYKVQISAVLK